jgi:hypothetical protein
MGNESYFYFNGLQRNDFSPTERDSGRQTAMIQALFAVQTEPTE